MDKSTKLSLIIVGVAILIIALAVFLLYPWQLTRKSSVSPVAPQETGRAPENNIGNALFEKSQNPIADKLPETNPFGANINPFEKVTNPLKTHYKNPFE